HGGRDHGVERRFVAEDQLLRHDRRAVLIRNQDSVVSNQKRFRFLITDYWLLTPIYRFAFSPAGISLVPSASASRRCAEPGRSGCCWLSCGAQPESHTISKVA